MGQKNFRLFSFILICLVAVSLAGCKSAQLIEGDARTQVLAYSEPQTDNLLAAITSGDYTTFKKDLDDAMLKAMPEDSFTAMVQKISSSYGTYQSRSVDHVEQDGDYIAVIYNAVFSKAPVVTLRVVFEQKDPHKIAGLWYK